jgi:ATP/ADP translocase
MSNTPLSQSETQHNKRVGFKYAKRSSIFTMKIMLYGFVFVFVGTLLGYFVTTHLNSINDVQHWMQQSAVYFFIFRLMLMGVIIYFYPFYIERLLLKNSPRLEQKNKKRKKKNKSGITLSDEELQSRLWLKSRWLIFGIFVFFELITHLDQIGRLFS